MKTVKLNLRNISEKEISLIVKEIKKGKIIAYPTDTIYGLSCLATDAKAINKIHTIKNQKLNRPLLVLISSLEMAKKYCYINNQQLKFLKKIWPIPHPNLSLARRGALMPVTVVLKRKSEKMKKAAGGLDSLAVRLPKSDFLIKIIKKIGEPIVSTSLNKVGDKPLDEVRNLGKYFNKLKPDLVIDAGRLTGKPSKLIDIREINNIKVLRK